MRVVYLVLLLAVGSVGRSGLFLDNGKVMKQTFQSIADAQTDLLLTTVDLIFLQVNELVANLTERMTLFENRLLEVERRLGGEDPGKHSRSKNGHIDVIKAVTPEYGLGLNSGFEPCFTGP
ncbi:hypothetical protein HOLleu_30472 [Holothuria leucospilota]|uniref:Uncharacterized protein n=1 Tax=Holothuria leucospilota TaxID=206669 RepID=A0A9Q1BKG0_HOLLE|nr:hypothetical protein HOLleu_30472 [Holothuria leucospilota]